MDNKTKKIARMLLSPHPHIRQFAKNEIRLMDLYDEIIDNQQKKHSLKQAYKIIKSREREPKSNQTLLCHMMINLKSHGYNLYQSHSVEICNRIKDERFGYFLIRGILIKNYDKDLRTKPAFPLLGNSRKRDIKIIPHDLRHSKYPPEGTFKLEE